MEFVILMSWRENLSAEERDEALVRRAGWEYPDGLEQIAEYWPASESPAVVVIGRAESYEPLMELAFAWGDKFAIEVSPAVSAEGGLRMGPEVMARVRS